MSYHTIENWKRDASLAKLVAATFPQYRRKKVSVNGSGRVCLQDLNWSGGTRSEYKGAKFAFNGFESAGSLSRFNQMAPWDSRQIEGQTIEIPAGHCVVRGGYFCGKESVLTIYVNPADMPKFLPAP